MDNCKNMAKIVSNRKQLTKLVELMEKNHDVAKGFCTKVMEQRKWEQFALILNGLGPLVREWNKWQRVWTDLKCKTKKKKTENKIEINATGGGPNRLHNFNDTEEAIIKILELNTCVDPPGQEFGLENTVSSDSETSKDIKHNLSNSKIEEKTPKKISRTEKLQDERMTLLEEQTSAQINFYEKMTNLMTDLKRIMANIEHYTKKSARNEDEILKTKREKLKLYKQNKENKDRDRKAKLQLKIEILEIKKQKQNLMEF